MARFDARGFGKVRAMLDAINTRGANMKIADLLDGLDFVGNFAYPELELLAKFLTYHDMDQGSVIFEEGDPGDFMFIVVQGRISIFKGGEHGRQLLSTEMRGRIIGEMAMIDQERRSATCIAETACELLILTHTNMQCLAKEHPAVAFHFMSSLARILSRRLRRASGMMADFLDQ